MRRVAAVPADEPDIAADDDDDEAGPTTDPSMWDSSMELQAMSAERPFPTHKIFTPVQRSKGTINKYAMHMSMIDWFRRCVPPTIVSLEGRFVAHTTKIQGQFHIDVQIAYWQLCQRVQSILGAHKSLKSYLETGLPKHLCEFLKCCNVVERYLLHIGSGLAPDLQVILTYAKFFYTFELRHRSFSAAFSQVSKPDLEKWLASYAEQAKDLPPPPAPPAIKEEVESEHDDDEDEDDEAPAQQSSGQAQGFKKGSKASSSTKRKKKSKTDFPLVSSRFDLFVSAAVHGVNLATEGVKVYFHKLSVQDMEDDRKIDRTLQELQGLIDAWEAWLPVEADLQPFGPILKSLMLVMRCAYKDEAKKPPSDEVRAARRLLRQEKRSQSLVSELAKTTIAYASVRVAMEASRKHSAQGLEDKAALAAFSAATERFESDFALAFENLEQWSAGSSDGGVDLQARKAQMRSLKTLLATLAAITERFSPTTLQEQIAAIGDSIGNVAAILSTSTWTFLYGFVSAIHMAFGHIGSVEVPSLSFRGGVVRVGVRWYGVEGVARLSD